MDNMKLFAAFILFIVGCSVVCADPPQPDPKQTPEYKSKLSNLIEILKNATYFDTYRECFQKTKKEFGTEWLDQMTYDSADNFISIPFAYAFEYICEDIGMGMFDGESNRLHDGVAFRNAVNERIKDEYRTIKDFFLKQADCLDTCYNNQDTMPKYDVVIPDNLPESVTSSQKEFAPPNHKIDVCAMKTCRPGLTDKQIFEVDRMVYDYMNALSHGMRPTWTTEDMAHHISICSIGVRTCIEHNFNFILALFISRFQATIKNIMDILLWIMWKQKEKENFKLKSK